MSLAQQIKSLRGKSKESLQDVADAVGISKAHIWELEKGRSRNPSFELTQKLAKHFGVSVDSLVGTKDLPDDQERQIQRIHRDLLDLSDRDRSIIEEMVRSMADKPRRET